MMKKKPPGKKCKIEKKTIKGKKAPVYININMENGNFGTIINCNRPSKHLQMDREIFDPVPSPCKPIEPICPDPCHACIPRRGELIINGGFENQPDPFQGWAINAGVGTIKPKCGDIPHQGQNAARLGTEHTRALIYQDVCGICPGMYFQLNFFLSAATACGNDKVFVMMEFLDHIKNPITEPVLEILVPRDSLSNESFTAFINATNVPAPRGSKFARISFATECGTHWGGSVHLDDVSLIAI
jgi:hypothetical protein